MAIPKKVMFACGAFIILAGAVTILSLNRNHQSDDWTALVATANSPNKDSSATSGGSTKQKDVKETTNNAQTSPEKTSESQTMQSMMVDIKGAVQHPGVYSVKKGSRVVDAIQSAGGFEKEADSDQINLSQHVTDEMVIYVPKKGEKPPNLLTGTSVSEGSGDQTTSSSDSSNTSKQIVHLNSCSLSDLENIPGIGPIKAKAIFDFRQQNGSFKSVDDLVNVTGIGEKTLEHIKPFVDLN